MDERVKVSVVVITYNQEEYVSQALDSILEQETNFKYEINIGDDCSKDRTQEILKEYAHKFPDLINLAIRETNVGVSRNIYDLFLKCKGDYIAILEGDDYWSDKDKLQRQCDFL